MGHRASSGLTAPDNATSNGGFMQGRGLLTAYETKAKQLKKGKVVLIAVISD